MKIKLFCFLLVIFYAQMTFADKGVVLVLNAPLFRDMDYDSTIVQYVRQGTIIYIHKKHIDDFKIQSSVEENEYKGPNQNKLVLNSEFYETLDRNANPAFIPAQFVKLITNDENESKQPISNYIHDPTDYRHAEPLPKQYPLYEPKKFRSGLNFSFGSPMDVNYNYPTEVAYKDLGYFAGINFYYVKNLIENPMNRFFLGGEIFVRRTISEYHLNESLIMSTEQKLIYGIGPVFVFDIFKRDRYIISLNTSVLLNFHNYHIYQDKQNSRHQTYQSDDCVYQGYSFSIHPGIAIQKSIIENLYLTFGSKISIHLPYTLQNKTGYNHDLFWAEGDNDVFQSSLSYNIDFNFGIQGTY